MDNFKAWLELSIKVYESLKDNTCKEKDFACDITIKAYKDVLDKYKELKGE